MNVPASLQSQLATKSSKAFSSNQKRNSAGGISRIVALLPTPPPEIPLYQVRPRKLLTWCDECTSIALILACDGLWDVVSDQEAIDFVIRVCSRGGTAILAAEKLRDESLGRGSRDNISVMVTILRPIAQHPTEGPAFSSTAQDGRIGIIVGDDWPRIKRINEGSLA